MRTLTRSPELRGHGLAGRRFVEETFSVTTVSFAPSSGLRD